MHRRTAAVVFSAALFAIISIPAVQALAIEEKADYRLQEKIRKAIEDLESKKGNTKREANKNLVKWGAPSVEPLLAVVKDWSEQPADLRVECVKILGEIGDERAVPVILSVINEDRLTMRYNAARALGQIGDKKAVPDLLKMLKDPEWEVRFYAVEALGEIGDAQASRPIAGVILEDSSDKVRLAAIESLDKIDGRDQADAVKRALSDASPEVRGYAAELSGSWSITESQPIIVKMLEDDRTNTVRASCAHALGAYGQAGSVPALIRALGDDYKDVKFHALESLKKISGQNYNYDQDAWKHWLELNKDKI